MATKFFGEKLQSDQATEQVDQIDNNRGGVGFVRGLVASLQRRVAAALAVLARLWAGFTGRIGATWRFVRANKMRLFLTILLVATVIGMVAALYLWRREITHFLAVVINMASARIRGSSCSRPDEAVVIGQSVNADGVERTVYRATDSRIS